MSITAQAYFLDVARQPLVRRELELPDPGPGEVIVEVKGCGLCHTDLGYADGSVPPKHALPLVLGHEVMGQVVMAGEDNQHLLDKAVIVPAVLPCGDCVFCREGRGNACPNQKMPGNDDHGGFSTYMLVPAAPLVLLDNAPPGFELSQLSVVADAVSTAYQAILRSGLQEGDAAFVIGAGGVGGFAIQIARALGAHVVACDVDDGRLTLMKDYGAEQTVNVRDRHPKDVRKEVHGHAKAWKIPSLRFRIFECSGTPAGQQVAYTLLSRGSTMLQVGYTPKATEVRLSNLMAFDATIHGSWGCPPEAYPAVLQLIFDGKVAVTPFIERGNMSDINKLLDDMANHRLTRRMVLDPTE